jgi:glycosyltransferase involved in cell wall biosynthesis
MSPKVSVIMPVFNGAQYVKEAVESVLNQDFADFEFIIIDDKSTDGTAEVINSIKDDRIRFFINEKNLGRAGSDNASLKYVTGEFIAKMDSDDICLPNRLSRQVQFLEKYPQINVVGSWMQNFGASQYLNKYPESPALARCATLFSLPVGNPSVMMRADLFLKEGMYYDEQLRQTEDFDFFARYAHQLVVATLPEALIHYRTYPDNFKKNVLKERGEVSHQVRENFLKAWGLSFSPEEARLHHALAHSDLSLAGEKDYQNYQKWLLKIYEYNLANPFFEDSVLKKYLAEKWFQFCYLNPLKRFGSLRSYQQSTLKEYYSIPLSLKIKFLIKGIKSSL